MTRALLICPVTHLLLLLQTIITLHASATNIKQRRWRRLGNLTIITLHASATNIKQRKWRRLGNLTIITLHASATRLMTDEDIAVEFFSSDDDQGGKSK